MISCVYILVLLTLVAPVIHVTDAGRLLVPAVMAGLMSFALYCPRRVPHWLQVSVLAVGLAGLVMALGIVSGCGPGLVLMSAAVAVLAVVIAGHDHQIMALVVAVVVPTVLAVPTIAMDSAAHLARLVMWSLLIWPMAVIVLEARTWRTLGPLLGLILVIVAWYQPTAFVAQVEGHASGRLPWAEVVMGLYAAVVIWPSLCRAHGVGARTVAAGVATASAVVLIGWLTGPWIDGWPLALSIVAVVAMALTASGLVALLATIPDGRVSMTLAGRLGALVGVATAIRLLSGVERTDIIVILSASLGVIVMLLLTGVIAGTAAGDDRSDIALVRRRPVTVAVTSAAHTLLQTMRTHSLHTLRTIRIQVLRWHHLPAVMLVTATYHAWPHLGRAWWGVLGTALLMPCQHRLMARPEAGALLLVLVSVVVAMGLGATPWVAMMIGSLAILLWWPYVRWPTAGGAWAVPSVLAIMALLWPWLPVPIHMWPALVLGAGISGLVAYLMVAGRASLPVLAVMTVAALLFLWRWVPLRDPSAPYVLIEDGLVPMWSMIVARLPLVLLSLHAIRVWSDDKPVCGGQTTRSVSTLLEAVEHGSVRWIMILAPAAFLLSWPLVLPLGLVAWIIVAVWSPRLTQAASAAQNRRLLVVALAWILAAALIGVGRSLEVIRASAGVGLRAGILGEIMLLCLADMLGILLSLGLLLGLRPWWQLSGRCLASGRRLIQRHVDRRSPTNADPAPA